MSKNKRRKSTVVIKDTGLKVSIKDRNNFKKGEEIGLDILHMCSTVTSIRSTNPRFDCLLDYYNGAPYRYRDTYMIHGVRYQLANEMYKVDRDAAKRAKIQIPVHIKRAIGL